MADIELKNISQSIIAQTQFSAHGYPSGQTPPTLKQVEDTLNQTIENIDNSLMETDPVYTSEKDSLNQRISIIEQKQNSGGFMVEFSNQNTQYQSNASTPTANGIQLVTAAELALHQTADEQYLTALANMIAAAQFTDAQKQQLAADILATVEATAVTQDELNQAITDASSTIIGSESTVYDTANAHLSFSKYQDGRMEITGTVQNDGSQIIFPSGYSFIDVSTVGCGCIYAGLDDQSNSIMHVGKIQVSATDFLWKASSFGVAVLGGAAISDDGMYRITLNGRWK